MPEDRHTSPDTQEELLMAPVATGSFWKPWDQFHPLLLFLRLLCAVVFPLSHPQILKASSCRDDVLGSKCETVAYCAWAVLEWRQLVTFSSNWDSLWCPCWPRAGVTLPSNVLYWNSQESSHYFPQPLEPLVRTGFCCLPASSAWHPRVLQPLPTHQNIKALVPAPGVGSL